jgi:hypothetical protein
VAGNGRAGEEVDEEELVLLVGVRGGAVDDIDVTVDTVVLKCVTVGGGEQRWGEEFVFFH